MLHTINHTKSEREDGEFSSLCVDTDVQVQVHIFPAATLSSSTMPLSSTLTTNDTSRRGTGSSSEARRLLVAPRPTLVTSTTATASRQAYSAAEALQTAALQTMALPLTSQYTSALTVGEWQPHSTQATAALQAACEPQVLMSTMGFGIDLGHAGNSSWDATEASVRALRDAMERSTLRLPYLSSLSDVQLQMHVKLGVPPKQNAPLEPMLVDLASVTAVLPCSIPLLPIQVVVGGLAMPAVGTEEPPVCAAVASINIQARPNGGTAPAAAQLAMERGPWAQLDLIQEAVEQQQPPVVQAPGATRRVNSMDMLARISEAVRENPHIVAGRTPLAAAIAAARSVEASSASDDDEGTEDDMSDESETPKRSTALPKKRLQPGLTPLKNERRFVEHNYHDHAYDQPNFGEDLKGPYGDTIPFPFKMHDILSRMDFDGHSDIMSWMPHGRAFKIHDLDGFHEHILPVYFRHTKKSSLLRQLNLYGFRRISAGPDKGSYYHELFLRGKRFLCGRMRRMKINGKRIRSAGNPEKEPNFCRMEAMPHDEFPPLHTIDPSLSSNISEEDDDGSVEEDMPDPSPDEPYSYLTLSFPFKLQAMLDQLESLGKTDVISWLPHGRAFRVHRPEIFVRDLMPSYFKMSKFSSFQRQLHMYSFQRLTTNGPDRGGYYHPQFLRGSPRLVVEMKRTRVNGKKCRKPADPSKEPDLHKLPPVPIIAVGSQVELPPLMPDPTLTTNETVN